MIGGGRKSSFVRGGIVLLFCVYNFPSLLSFVQVDHRTGLDCGENHHHQQQHHHGASSIDASPSSGCLTWDAEESLRTWAGKKMKKQYRENWASLLNEARDRQQETTPPLRGAEVGVYLGTLSKVMLESVPSLGEYILVDPWRHLDDWNKPFNKEDNEFQAIFETAMNVTKLNKNYGHKVTVLRTTSYDGAQQVQDGSLDFVYIDGDHTAKGAMKDLLLWSPKVKCGGLVIGDDYRDMMPRNATFEPTMVKSAVDAYTEAQNTKVYNLGKGQWGFVKK